MTEGRLGEEPLRRSWRIDMASWAADMVNVGATSVEREWTVSTYVLLSYTGRSRAEARGMLTDGTPFHFAARDGLWTLRIAATPFDDAASGTTIASGPDRTGGYMWREEVVAVLDEHLPARVAGSHAA
jgi:hypothetical protein